MSCESIIFLLRLFLHVYGVKYNERMPESAFDMDGLIYALLMPSTPRTYFRTILPRLQQVSYARLLFQLKT